MQRAREDEIIENDQAPPAKKARRQATLAMFFRRQDGGELSNVAQLIPESDLVSKVKCRFCEFSSVKAGPLSVHERTCHPLQLMESNLLIEGALGRVAPFFENIVELLPVIEEEQEPPDSLAPSATVETPVKKRFSYTLRQKYKVV